MTAGKLGDNFFYVDGFEKSRFWPGVLWPSLALASAIVHDFAKSYKQYTRLLQYKGGSKKRRKIHPVRPPVSPEHDQAVFDFLEEERSEGRVVTNKMLL